MGGRGRRGGAIAVARVGRVVVHGEARGLPSGFVGVGGGMWKRVTRKRVSGEGDHGGGSRI